MSHPHPFADSQPLVNGAFWNADSEALLGAWPVYASERAVKKLVKLRDGHAKKIVMKKTVELSQGFFTESNAKRINKKSKNHVPIFEAKLSRNLRLIWQVGLTEAADGIKQILVLRSVESHDSMDESRNTVDHFVIDRGPAYARMVEAREGNDKVFTPKTFLLHEYKQGYLDSIAPAASQGLTDEEKIEAHEQLSLAKLFKFDKLMIASIISDDSQAALPFKISPQEEEVVVHPGGSLVIGRSGSGKTSVLIYKMIALERFFASDSSYVPTYLRRQLFITQSPFLRGRVKAVYDGHMRSLALATKTLAELEKLAASDHGGRDVLFVDDDLEGKHDELRGRTLAQLRKEDFPLFLSYDMLLEILEDELGIKDRIAAASANEHKRTKSRGSFSSPPATSTSFAQAVGNLKQIDLATFSQWWISFDHTLTKQLDPTAVWGELLGVIKGSALLAKREKGWLEEEEYCALSERVAASFKGMRERIYAIFLAYQKRRRELGMFDHADRTHAIIQELKKRGSLRNIQIGYLSVDEAQDLLLLDYQLLRLLCSNPLGITCVGDTAQVISEGSSFKFQELSSSWWKTECEQADLEGREPFHLKQFQLTKNYRSHKGITHCANAIVKALLHLFPDSIDRLNDETSISEGPSPLFIAGGANSDSFGAFFSKDSKIKIEFGAKHCILVRDEAGRKDVRAQLGTEGLVLTILEAKGLEFDSVLLWKFFDHSLASPGCVRVMDNVPPQQDVNAPRFDHIKHAALKIELRQLYVAITRARKTVWIWETSTNWGEGIVKYLHACEALTLADSKSLPSLGSASTAEDWEDVAVSLSARQIHQEAALAFLRAGDHWRHDLELARDALKTASTSARAYGIDSSKAREQFCLAGELFASVANTARAEVAKSYHSRAGECFQQGLDFVAAGREFEKAEKFEWSAVAFRKGGSFDEAIRICQAHSSSVAPETSEPIFQVARIEYSRKGELEKGSKLFSSSEDYIEFLQGIGFSSAAKDLFVKMKDYGSAARIEFNAGNFLQAAIQFTRAGKDEEANQAYRAAIWTLLPIGAARHAVARDTGSGLLVGLERVPGLRPKQATEIALFKTFLEQPSIPEFFRLSKDPAFATSDSHRLLALDAGIHLAMQQLDAIPHDKLVELVDAIRQYASTIRKIFVFEQETSDLSLLSTQRILGIAEDDDSDDLIKGYRILSSSPLAFLASDSGNISVSFGARLPTVIDAPTVHSAGCTFLYRRLYDLLVLLSSKLDALPWLRGSCLRFRWTNHCDDRDCHRPHTSDVRRQITVEFEVAELMRSSIDWVTRPRGMGINLDEGKRLQRIWCERIVLKALPPRPHLVAGVTELEKTLASEHHARIKQMLATYSLSRLWELRGRALFARYFLWSFLTSAWICYDLEPLRLRDTYGLLPSRISRALPDYLLSSRGASLPYLLCHGLTQLSEPQIPSHSLLTVLECHDLILQRELSVDAGSFLQILEEVGGLLMLWSRQVSTNSPLWHGLVLTKGMAEAFARRHINLHLLQGTVNILDMLLNILSRVIWALAGSGNKHFQHEGQTMGYRDFVRHLFIARCVRFLVLLGINIPTSRANIFRRLTNIHRTHAPAEQNYIQILDARTWNAIEQAMSNGAEESDQLLAFLIQGQPLPKTPLPGSILTLRGSSVANLYEALAPKASKLSPTARPFQPAQVPVNPNIAQEPDDDTFGTDERTKAVEVIQRLVRTHLRNATSRKPQATRFKKIWGEFDDYAEKGLVPTVHLLKLRQIWLRGVLAELHYALEESRRLLGAKKQKLQLDMARVSHQELEVVMHELDVVTTIIKKVNSLRRVTSTASRPLSKGIAWKAVLKVFVQQVETLAEVFEDLKPYLEENGKQGIGFEVKVHFEIVLKAVNVAREA